jgi:hypothetical protein
MNRKQLISENYLSHYLEEFMISSIPSYKKIVSNIKSLIDEYKSGKIESLKEEEFKSRFLLVLFGDILGFNYGNSNEWLLREEKKSVVDGKKPDGALGFFYIDSTRDSVYAVIEIKDANTAIDSPQKRKNNQTPVEQAFSYAHKMGGNCKWVIVSNIKETRFYLSSDSSRYQAYYLEELTNEKKLKELLFLFHKDFFIKKKEKSSTEKLVENYTKTESSKDKPIHIIDRIYFCLKRFAGFGFVDPNFLANLYPFNILEEYVWHYSDYNLFTINCEVFQLLKEIKVNNNEIVLSSQLLEEIQDEVVIEAKEKLEYSLSFLNKCQVHSITAIKDYKRIIQKNKKVIGFSHKSVFNFTDFEEGISLNIQLLNNKKCQCLSCIYRSLDFNLLVTKLKTNLNNSDYLNPEYAFGNYLVASNNYKTTYNIYKYIENETKGKEGKEIVYFLTKLNIKYLQNLILADGYEDSPEILKGIRNIDLNKVVYDELEYCIDNEVKKYLIEIKEENLIYRIQDKIDGLLVKIEKLKKLYDRGGQQSGGTDLHIELINSYFFLYLHINANFIIYDSFYRYKSIAKKVFKGLILSNNTPVVGFKTFNDFLLTEAIINIPPTDLQELLKEVKSIEVDSESLDNLLIRLNNFTTSYYRDGFFNDQIKNSKLEEYLIDYSFTYNYSSIFSNIFSILLKLKISKEQFKVAKHSILKFLKTESILAWYQLDEFKKFILAKGDLFEQKELLEILKLAISKDECGNSKYSHLIKSFPDVFISFYPNFKIEEPKLISLAILKCSSINSNYTNYLHLVPMVNICREDCKKLLFSAFENELDTKFNACLYEAMLEKTDYSFLNKDYFSKYIEYINNCRGDRAIRHGKHCQSDVVFMHFAYIIYKLKIIFDDKKIEKVKKVNQFEEWILNPFEFNYENFDSKWLLDVNYPCFLDSLMTIDDIKTCLELELKENYNNDLAKIRYEYFS